MRERERGRGERYGKGAGRRKAKSEALSEEEWNGLKDVEGLNFIGARFFLRANRYRVFSFLGFQVSHYCVLLCIKKLNANKSVKEKYIPLASRTNAFVLDLEKVNGISTTRKSN